MSEEPVEYTATVRKRRRWSSIWVIPIVALALASWLVWKNYADKGPLAHVIFETADSIKVGDTEVRCRSVRVGVVESVTLAGDLGSVSIGLRLDPASAGLLRKDSRFWVVRPRVTTSNVSGLGTLLTGAYIELEPGESKTPADHYVGLEEPPVTSASIPGLRLNLVADDVGSLSVGSPIYYRDFRVGQVERRNLEIEARKICFEVFIEHEYASLVSTGTRFWNTSGVEVTAGTNGFKLKTPSLQAMVAGGATFAVPKGEKTGEPVSTGATFTLYANETEAQDAEFEIDQRLMLYFDQSVRGLERGAPVEFRGIPLGVVVEISLKHLTGGDPRIPVIIELDTRSMHPGGTPDITPEQRITAAISRGLCAKLGTGSLLTGALFIDLDFYPEAPVGEAEKVDDMIVMPTKSSGLAQLEAKLYSILTKLEALPFDETLERFGRAAAETSTTLSDARKTFTEVNDTLADLRVLLASDSTKAIPEELNATLAELRRTIDSIGPGGNVQGDLRRTLDEMRSALRSFEILSRTIEEKPNSLLFGKDSSGDPIPKARPVR